MNSKRNIIALVIVAITLIIILVGGVISLIGSNDSKKSESVESIIMGNAESTINCIINSDYSDGYYCVDIDGEIKTESTLKDSAELIVSKMKYKLNDITIQEGNETAIIQAEFETVDMQDMVLRFSEYEYNQETKDLIDSEIRRKNYKTKNFEIPLVMVKMDEEWYLWESPDFSDVLTGGMYSMSIDIEQSFLNDVTERNR